jgi:hypothetical protein
LALDHVLRFLTHLGDGKLLAVGVTAIFGTARWARVVLPARGQRRHVCECPAAPFDCLADLEQVRGRKVKQLFIIVRRQTVTLRQDD